MLELKKVNYAVVDEKTKQEKVVLKDITLAFPENKLTVITGQNGSGKSTLIKLIMGVISPTSGKIFYNGKDITKLRLDERANLGFTIAFQQPVRFKGLTVKNLLDVASEKSNKLSDACEYLSKVGLCAKNYLNRELDSTLSGGELKRIELAISLAKGGELYLFDEPEAGIDLWSFENLVDLFKGLKGKTVIIVSHQEKILEKADYLLLIENDNYKLGTKKEILPLLKIEPKCKKLGGQNE